MLLPPKLSSRLLLTLLQLEVWQPSKLPPRSTPSQLPWPRPSPPPSSQLASLTVSPPSMLSLPSTPSPATPMLLLDSHTLLCQSSLPLRLPRETTSNQNILQPIHRLSE